MTALAYGILSLGFFFIVTGAVGIVRFPDFFHPASRYGKKPTRSGSR